MWFDRLTTGFDRPVLTGAEGLTTNGFYISIDRLRVNGYLFLGTKAQFIISVPHCLGG